MSLPGTRRLHGVDENHVHATSGEHARAAPTPSAGAHALGRAAPPVAPPAGADAVGRAAPSGHATGWRARHRPRGWRPRARLTPARPAGAHLPGRRARPRLARMPPAARPVACAGTPPNAATPRSGAHAL